MLCFAISVNDNFVLDAQPREYLALWGLKVLPDKLWCHLGIACRYSGRHTKTIKKRENKSYNEKKRDTITEAIEVSTDQKTSKLVITISGIIKLRNQSSHGKRIERINYGK